MITLRDCLGLAPTTIYYLGTEDEFLSLIEPLGNIANADKISIEFINSEIELIDTLYALKPTKLVIFGLISYLISQNKCKTAQIIEVFTNLSNTAHEITYGDTKGDCPNKVLDQLVARCEALVQLKN